MATQKKSEKVSTEKTQKGYNEKNPAQPQGVFTPDHTKTKGEEPKSNVSDVKEKRKKR